MEKKFVQDKYYVIKNRESGETLSITPKAVESCMRPGEFWVTPIEISEDTITRSLTCDNTRIAIAQADLISGKVSVEEYDFVPQPIRKKEGCHPCTNCGRCSW